MENQGLNLLEGEKVLSIVTGLKGSIIALTNMGNLYKLIPDTKIEAKYTHYLITSTKGVKEGNING